MVYQLQFKSWYVGNKFLTGAPKRGGENAKLNPRTFVTAVCLVGVPYKHLGLICWAAQTTQRPGARLSPSLAASERGWERCSSGRSSPEGRLRDRAAVCWRGGEPGLSQSSTTRHQLTLSPWTHIVVLPACEQSWPRSSRASRPQKMEESAPGPRREPTASGGVRGAPTSWPQRLPAAEDRPSGCREQHALNRRGPGSFGGW